MFAGQLKRFAPLELLRADRTVISQPLEQEVADYLERQIGGAGRAPDGLA